MKFTLVNPDASETRLYGKIDVTANDLEGALEAAKWFQGYTGADQINVLDEDGEIVGGVAD